MAPTEEASGRNHPLAFRMAVIAAINQNIVIACIFGSFAVLLTSVEARLGVGRQLSTLAISAVTLIMAVSAPFVGSLAAKGSIRLILLVGGILSTSGFLLLAATHSFMFYLIAYGLLLGPGMAAGAILPAALVTRWYVVNRGRALGIVCAPLAIVVVPLLTQRVLQASGVTAAYVVLAALSAICVVANVFIVDRPPGGVASEGDVHGVPASSGPPGRTMADLLRSPRYWALVFGFIAPSNGMVIITSQMLPIVKPWGIAAGPAATLLAIQAFVGIAGTLLFGWVADRIGGARALLLIALDSAILWALLLLQPGFAGAAVMFGLLGLHCSGMLPAISVALSQAFGRESFSRGYGLCNLLNLPFAVLCVPASGLVFARTGSYAGAILGQSLLLAAVTLGLVLLVTSRAEKAAERADRLARAQG